MQLGKFIDVFLAWHVSGTYAQSSGALDFECSIWFSASSFWVGGGLERCCVGRIYGAVARHHPHRKYDLHSGSQDHRPSKNSVQKIMCCNATYNYLVASSWHFTLFHQILCHNAVHKTRRWRAFVLSHSDNYGTWKPLKASSKIVYFELRLCCRKWTIRFARLNGWTNSLARSQVWLTLFIIFVMCYDIHVWCLLHYGVNIVSIANMSFYMCLVYVISKKSHFVASVLCCVHLR